MTAPEPTMNKASWRIPAATPSSTGSGTSGGRGRTESMNEEANTERRSKAPRSEHQDIIIDGEEDDTDRRGGGRHSRPRSSRRAREDDRDEHKDKYSVKHPANRATMEILLKAVLQVFQRLRDVESILLEVYLVNKDCPVAKDLTEEIGNYERAVRAAGKGHSYGQPHKHLYLRLLESLSQQDKVLPEIRTQLKAEYERLNALDKDEADKQILQVVQLLRITKTFKSDTKRVLLSQTRNPLQMHITEALVQCGLDRKWGRAPRGALEDELEKWLTRTFAS